MNSPCCQEHWSTSAATLNELGFQSEALDVILEVRGLPQLIEAKFWM